jgi:hypothetical protein
MAKILACLTGLVGTIVGKVASGSKDEASVGKALNSDAPVFGVACSVSLNVGNNLSISEDCALWLAKIRFAGTLNVARSEVIFEVS